MILTKDDKQNFRNTDKCYICIKNTLEKTFVKDTIFHHVIFHHLKGYDSQFIMRMIDEIDSKHTYKNNKRGEKQMGISVIPKIIWKNIWHSRLENIWVLSTAFSS